MTNPRKADEPSRFVSENEPEQPDVSENKPFEQLTAAEKSARLAEGVRQRPLTDLEAIGLAQVYALAALSEAIAAAAQQTAATFEEFAAALRSSDD